MNIKTFKKDPDWRYWISGAGDSFECTIYRGEMEVTSFKRRTESACHNAVDLFTQPINEPERGRINGKV